MGLKPQTKKGLQVMTTRNPLIYMVPPAGIEPATRGLGIVIQPQATKHHNQLHQYIQNVMLNGLLCQVVICCLFLWLSAPFLHHFFSFHWQISGYRYLEIMAKLLKTVEIDKIGNGLQMSIALSPPMSQREKRYKNVCPTKYRTA